MTNASGSIIEAIDYYPYGAARMDTAPSQSQRKYIGQISDSSGLDYLNARYYNSNQGQFISEDPVFLAIGSPGLNALTHGHLQDLLTDPQLFNAYGYARDNPINRKDPSGLLTNAQIEQELQIIQQEVNIIQEEFNQVLSGGGGGGNPTPSAPTPAPAPVSQPAPSQGNSGGGGGYVPPPPPVAISPSAGGGDSGNNGSTIPIGPSGGVSAAITISEADGENASFSNADELRAAVTGFSEGQYGMFLKQAAKDGLDSLVKSKQAFEDLIADHFEKIESAQGYVSSMEKELVNFQEQINAIEQILEIPPGSIGPQDIP